MGEEKEQNELDALLTQLQLVDKLAPVLGAMMDRIEELEKEVIMLKKNGEK